MACHGCFIFWTSFCTTALRHYTTLSCDVNVCRLSDNRGGSSKIPRLTWTGLDYHQFTQHWVGTDSWQEAAVTLWDIHTMAWWCFSFAETQQVDYNLDAVKDCKNGPSQRPEVFPNTVCYLLEPPGKIWTFAVGMINYSPLYKWNQLSW